jgi:UDP-glucose 4-epimerase
VRVFITGGAGFIGSHLCDALVAEGKEVTILDNLSTGSKKNIAHLEGKIKIFQGDIRDQKLVESLVEGSDLVLHMAAALGVDNILENPIESISTNFYGSEVVLNAAAKSDKRIVIASTSEIYGKNPKQPLSETDDRIIGSPQKLRWSYSDAKALEEATAYFLFVTKKLKVTTIRFFNTVGPRQTGKYGMVIPRFVKAAVENKPIKVFGDGSQSRVFCHIEDTVKAVLLLAETNKSIGEVFNIGGTGEITILDLAKMTINLTNSESEITFNRDSPPANLNITGCR